MYVSSEVRRREIPDSTPDPSHYASTTNSTSFLTILSEVGRSQDDFADEDAARTREVEPESSGEVETAGEDPAVTGESTSETKETATEKTDANEGTEPSSTDPAVAVTSPTAPVAIPVVATEVSVAKSESGVAVATSLASALVEDVPAAETVATSTPAEPAASVESSAESVAVDSIEGAVEPALSAEMTIALDVEPAPATPVFPKTLNAILAEGAVRPVSESAPESAQPPAELTAAPTEASSDAAAKLPDSTPIPHATAMESGGVKPQASTIPRLPMSNLPGELAQQMHLMQQEGSRTMRLRLVPENLGELQIEIQGTGDAMKVRLISANPAVRDALESQMGDLKDAMQKQGLALDQATVDGEPNRRGLPQEQERRPATTSYRETSTTPERPDAGTRRVAPMMPGSGALNVLA